MLFRYACFESARLYVGSEIETNCEKQCRNEA